MVRQLVPWWRPDFLSLSGEELYRLFASGRSLNFMNGTWYLKDIHPLQEQMRRVAPSAAFEFGTFPFPELDGEWARLARAGGVNQNTGLRGCLLLPRQQREPWREEAAIRLAQFLTAPHITQIVFDESNVYDLPAMPEVRAKPESQPLVPRTRYAFLPLAYFEGYDAQAVSEFWPAWQAYLGSPETEAELDRFLERLSASHRGALRRAAAAFPEDVDPEFLTAALGADWEAEW
jgi:ABC-type glycerol-3-phosphate transport system substrate-binding protein